MIVETAPASMTFMVNGTPTTYAAGMAVDIAGRQWTVFDAVFDATPTSDTHGNVWPGMWTVTVKEVTD